ncbi:MAG TPA: dephospho-CoA kinase [Gemmatimonadaceae bacterium]|nr:dephospho-CoA kinase [Gemmatimonadaceae bacterium]
MLIVGLTGNIASGKSTVARLLSERGATIIDADVLARRTVDPGTPAHAAITERWGNAVLAADGTIDREALRRVVFGDPRELEALNNIVHPHVRAMRDELIDQARSRGDQIVVCDIPLLFERGLVDDFDRIVLVDAPREVRFERLVRERKLPHADAMEMIAAQMPSELKRARANYVIDNTSTLQTLAERVEEIWSALQRDAATRDAKIA